MPAVCQDFFTKPMLVSVSTVVRLSQAADIRGRPKEGDLEIMLVFARSFDSNTP